MTKYRVDVDLSYMTYYVEAPTADDAEKLAVKAAKEFLAKHPAEVVDSVVVEDDLIDDSDIEISA